MTSRQISIQSEWKKFSHLFKREDIPAKTILLKEGEVAKKNLLHLKRLLSTFLQL